MEVEVEGRRPVGRQKTWSKVVEEDTRKVNSTEDISVVTARIMSDLRRGKLR